MFRRNKDIVSVFGVTTIILLIPFVAMRFTNEVDWDETDFIVMGILLFGTGLLIVLASRAVRNMNKKIAIIALLIIALLLIWAHLAVGLVDGWPFAGS